MTWKCWHCGVSIAPSGSPAQSVWAIIRIAGYLDEHDVQLCQICARDVLITQANMNPIGG